MLFLLWWHGVECGHLCVVCFMVECVVLSVDLLFSIPHCHWRILIAVSNFTAKGLTNLQQTLHSTFFRQKSVTPKVVWVWCVAWSSKFDRCQRPYVSIVHASISSAEFFLQFWWREFAHTLALQPRCRPNRLTNNPLYNKTILGINDTKMCGKSGRSPWGCHRR